MKKRLTSYAKGNSAPKAIAQPSAHHLSEVGAMSALKSRGFRDKLHEPNFRVYHFARSRQFHGKVWAMRLA